MNKANHSFKMTQFIDDKGEKIYQCELKFNIPEEIIDRIKKDATVMDTYFEEECNYLMANLRGWINEIIHESL